MGQCIPPTPQVYISSTSKTRLPLKNQLNHHLSSGQLAGVIGPCVGCNLRSFAREIQNGEPPLYMEGKERRGKAATPDL